MISRHDARAPASTELPWWSRPIVVPGWPYLVMVGIVAVGFTFCGPKSMSWDAIEGQVVDSQTQQPIAGAAVIAAWSLSKWGLSHPRDAGTLMAIEVRTDTSGRYRIPRWGPRGYKEGYLDAKSPQVFVIRQGYQPAMRNGWGGAPGESAPRLQTSRERVWPVPAIGLDRPLAALLALCDPGKAAPAFPGGKALLVKRPGHGVQVPAGALRERLDLRAGLGRRHVRAVDVRTRRCRAARHEMILMQVLAPEELEFPFSKPTQFRHIEQPAQRLLIDPHRFRKRYLERFQAFCADLKSRCGAAGIDYLQLTTAEPYDKALGAYLSSRSSG